MKLSEISKFIIALILGLVTVFVIDPLDPKTVSTPFCLGIVLMGLSLRQGAPLVAAVSVVYIVLTHYALVTFHQQHEAQTHIFTPHPTFWLFQREGLFFVLCGLSIHLAHYRADTERILGRLRTILVKLPVPVMVSDAAGKIAYANEAAFSKLHCDSAEVVGRSYFDYLLCAPSKDKAMQRYDELFAADTNGSFEMEMSPFGKTKKETVQLICIGAAKGRVMITVLEASETPILQAALMG